MTIEIALKQLIPGLQEIYGDLINSVILYGSTARGTRTNDSDMIHGISSSNAQMILGGKMN